MAGTLLASAGASSKRLAPSYGDWTPEPYQLRGTDFLIQQGSAALWLEPGMRKTSIVLNAFCRLQSSGRARQMLVVAPKKVCELVWAQEAAKWAEFRHLKVTFLHGPKKDGLLRDGADIHLINPEGVEWLAGKYGTHPRDWPYDVFCVDELTKFKNSQAERHKALMGKSKGGIKYPSVLKHSKWRWGLTGTPNPNGYLDLFGQFLLLDDGAALGRYITHYRDTYFQADFDGFNYVLQPGGAARIEKRLEPYVFCLNADDYIRLPPEILDVRKVALPKAAQATYDKMKREHIVDLGSYVLEAGNTAAAYSKLAQMANGAVYAGEEERVVIPLHDVKLEALDTLLEELDGKQLLLAYEFNHDRDRLRQRYGDRIVFLADCRNAAEADDVVRRWNAGLIEILACHPASAGHGLNLQEGNAHHLCWLRPCWDLELWDQFNRRLRRSGNAADHVYNHVLVAEGTVDELSLTALDEKDTTQRRLRTALTTHMGGAPGQDEAPPWNEDQEEIPMAVQKLTRAGAQDNAAGAAPAPKGWGKPAGAAAPAAASNDTGPTQAEKIDAKLTGGGFSQDVADKAAAMGASVGSQASSEPASAPQTAGYQAPIGLSAADVERIVENALVPVRELALEARDRAGAANAVQGKPLPRPTAYDVQSLANAALNAVQAVKELADIDGDEAQALWEVFKGVLAAGAEAIVKE